MVKGILAVSLSRFLELPAKLRQIDAMLRGFACADENHWNVPAVAFFEDRIFLDVDFAKDRAELAKQRRDGGLRFLAEMTSGARVQGNVARSASSEP